MWDKDVLGSATVTFTIMPKKVAVPVAKTDLVYNGDEQTGVENSYDSIYTVKDNAGTDAGNYTATAELNNTNYCWADSTTGAKSISWSIAKATYDLSEILFKNGVFAYDGYEHSLAIKGTLPEGLAVSYSANNLLRQPGTNEVTATITVKVPSANWKLDPDPTVLTAKLIVLPAGGSDPQPPGPDPRYADPDPIAFMSIARVSEAEWELVVTDAVQWCNYSLFATNTLEGGFVITNSAGAFVVDPVTNFQWKSTDTKIRLTLPKDGNQLFWKAVGQPGLIPNP